MKLLKTLTALVAAALVALAPVSARAAQATYAMPTTGPMSMATFVSTYLNPAMGAILTLNSGTTAPSASGQPGTYQLWVDTSTTPRVLKVYDGTNWLTLGTIDTSGHLYGVAGDSLTLRGSSSGTVTVAAPATASGTLTLPAATDTLVGKATTDTFTNKTFDTAGTGNSLKINGTAVTAVSGSGATVALTTSPAFTTPGLGAATATTINKVTITAPASAATLTIPNGVTLTGPASSGTAMTLGNAETVTGAKSFNDATLVLKGSSSGTTTLHAAAAAGTTALTFPAGTTDFSATGGTHQVVRQSSAGAALTVSQLACADLSDSVASCATDATNASNISSGTLAAARGGAGTVSGALKGNGSGVVSQAACADLSNGATGCSTATGTSGATIPLLNGANTWSGVQSITDADLALLGATSGSLKLHAAAVAGTSSITFPAGTTDFSATGGSHQFVKQSSAGAALTVGQPACADLSDSAASCATDATNASNIGSGTLAGARMSAANLAASGNGGVTGTLPVGNGGTGAATLTGLVKGNGTAAMTAATAGTDYYAPGSTDVAVADGGTGASTASGARVNLNVDQVTTHGDSAYTILSTDRTVATSAALTSPRTWTLPAASSVNAGQHLVVADFAGGVTGTNTLTIARAGSDTVNGVTSVVLSAGYAYVDLISDGTSKWAYNAASGGGGGSGTVTQIVAGTGLTGGAITTTGTIALSTPVAVANGGTGLSSGTSGGILGYTATGTLASSAALTNHAIVLGAGAGATPTALGSLGTTTTILHGNASGAPSFGSLAFADIASGALAAASDYQANTASTLLGPNAVWSAASPTALTDATTIAVDLSTGINFSVTLGGNRTLGNPTNAKVGQSGVFRVTQDATGSRTLAYSSDFKFAGGAACPLTTTASKTDYIFYFVYSSTEILLSCVLNVSELDHRFRPANDNARLSMVG